MCCGQKDGWRDRRKDNVKTVYPSNTVCGGYKNSHFSGLVGRTVYMYIVGKLLVCSSIMSINHTSTPDYLRRILR